MSKTMSVQSFLDPHTHGFVKIAVAVPEIELPNPVKNAKTITGLARQARNSGASIVLFPELCLSGYSCDDLFQQNVLLQACEQAIYDLSVDAPSDIIIVVGVPAVFDGSMYNCAVVIHQNAILGIVPKTYLPNYREFYEARHFIPGNNVVSRTVTYADETGIPFGTDLLFKNPRDEKFCFHIEICEDVWVPIPPSSKAALAGATILLNLSASNITIGKSEYRHNLISNQSARCMAAYAYTAAGPGESTTDLAWDGHAMVYENGKLLAESKRFEPHSQLIFADVDLNLLMQERIRQNSFSHNRRDYVETNTFRTIHVSPNADTQKTLDREVDKFPYVPFQQDKLNTRCEETYQIQVQGLTQRLKATGIQKVVMGISGGLDSTHALIVVARAFDILGLPRKNILAYTMPGFATSDRTKSQALDLMDRLGCTSEELDIRPSCMQMFKDIGHPFAEGFPIYDVTFENVQAGERTSHLFRISNYNNAMVVGTGDLSELALGWCTYGVGDHMSHYNVNASVPKTLIQKVIHWVSQQDLFDDAVCYVLEEILDTEISPELVPGDDDTQPSQKTEDIIGPYELHDFFLYQILRFGFDPIKVAFLAWTAWQDKYSIEEIKKHLKTFLFRFFQISQFKRSCVPNGPKVGSGGSLSPRGDYRAPSDSVATIWINEANKIPEDLK